MQKQRPGRQSAEVAEQTRHSILVAAQRMFAEQGFEAVSLREIAKEAHTTYSLIHHYFGSKEDIWREVVKNAFKGFSNAIRESIEQADGSVDAVEVVKGIVRTFLLQCARSPEIVKLLLHEGTKGGERLVYVMSQTEQLSDEADIWLLRVQQQGHMQHFTDRTFVLYLLTAGVAPFGLPALANLVLEKNILDERQVHEHIDFFLLTLFPNA